MIELEVVKMISQFGIAGISVYFMYRLASNHIDSNTEAINELGSKIDTLIIYLKGGEDD